MTVKSYEHYDVLLEYPKLVKQQYPEPKRKDFKNYTDHGVAMDQWERDVIGYNVKRKNLIENYQNEQQKMLTLFFADLCDELSWNLFTDKQKNALTAYVWEEGHSNGLSECYNVAYSIDELVSELLEKE